MAFMGQIDLGDAVPLGPYWGLPSSGLLSCFCSLDTVMEGNARCARVLLTPPQLPVGALSPPEDLRPDDVLGELVVTLQPQLTLPSINAREFDQVPLTELDPYLDAIVAVDGEYPVHRLLGQPSTVQNDVLEEAAGWAPELLGDDTLQGERWRLLLQVQHDDYRLGVSFGDGGTLFFCLPEVDLLNGRLDRVIALAQSQ